MAGKGKSSRGRGGKSAAVGGRGNNPAGKPTGGIRINAGNPSSSHSSNPSSNTRPSVSRPSSSSVPSQYPPSTQPPSSQQVQSPPPPHDPVQIQHPPPPAVQIPDNHPPYQPSPPPPEQQDFDQLLNDLLALPGRENLPLLSQHPIPDVQTLWFNRDKGKLTRVISGIFRKKFDGPYFSWSVTPIHIQERYFRTFARKYNWDLGITELVKDHFWTIAKRRMKGIVSQAKTSGQRPVWIHPTIWTEMSDHWNTLDATEKSENASQSRNSDRGGLGRHKHLSGQSSYINVQQNMEEELGRPVSLGEVFVKTHTRADGNFVDQKAKQVAEAYEKNIEEVMAEMDSDGLETSDHSSQQSTHRTLSIQEKDDIFLKCTETDDKGNHFGLGRLRDTINKGKKRKKCSESPSSASLLEIQQLREEARNNESRIKNLEMLVSYLSTSNPGLAEFMANQAPPTAAASEPSSST